MQGFGLWTLLPPSPIRHELADRSCKATQGKGEKSRAMFFDLQSLVVVRVRRKKRRSDGPWAVNVPALITRNIMRTKKYYPYLGAMLCAL